MTLHNLGHTTPEQDAALMVTLSLIDDANRLDFLERLLWSGKIGNGVALSASGWAADGTPEKFVSVVDLADQDGSDLGEQLEKGPTLRDAIDRLMETFGDV